MNHNVQKPPTGRLIFPAAEKHVQGHNAPQLVVEDENVPQASGAIESFSQPRSKRVQMIVTAVISAILVGLLAAFINGLGRETGTPTPAPSPSASEPGKLPGMPFDDVLNQANGRWMIVDSVWLASKVQLKLRIFSDSGTVTYGFRAFTNDDKMEVVRPTGLGPNPVLVSGSVSEGESVEGWVEFLLPTEEFTVVLTNSQDRQLSALLAKP